MDLYISKQCKHCEQLLRLFRENKHLIPYFNIMDIESNPYPQSLTSVPTLIKDGQLFMGKSLNAIINDVNRFDMEKNGVQQSQQPPQQSRQPPKQMPDERQMQMQQFSQQQRQPQQQQQPPPQQQSKGDDDIVGMCGSEGCMYESIDNSNNNYLNGDYCFLDDGYSESKPENPKETGEKGGRFDNSAYEAMMKSRGM